MSAILIYFFCTLLTSIISATAGMAGGTVLLVFLLHFFPLQVVIPLHALNQLVSNGWRAFLLRRAIVYSYFYPFIVGALIGNAISFTVLLQNFWPAFLNLIIALMVFYAVFKPKKMPEIRLEKRGFFVLGIIVGFLGTFLGATGLFLGAFMVRKDFDKEQTIATQAAMQSVCHFLKVISFSLIGFKFMTYFSEISAMFIGTILGTLIGVKLLTMMSESLFKKIFKVVLVICALKIVFDTFT